MKRLLSIPFCGLMFLLFLAQEMALAQQVQPPYSIGFIGGNRQVNDTTRILFNGHQNAMSGTAVDANGVRISGGFPYPVPYFPTVFEGDPFCSKGYFPDVVQLNWKIKSLSGRISRFLIYRKPLGGEGDSTLVANIPADQYAWNDQYADKGVLYKYTIYAKGLADNLRLPYFNYVESTGFMYPVGTASGRITFEGGTAVEGVTVVAEASGNLTGKSLLLDGANDYLWIPHRSGHSELELREGFSLQMWTRYEGGGAKGTLFSKGNNYELNYNGTQLDFQVAGTQLSLPFAYPVDSFFHVTASYSVDSLFLYVQVDDRTSFSAKAAAGAQPAANSESLTLGKNASGQYYQGYVDEIRLWKRVLGPEEISRDYARYISGNENNLSAYLRLRAGVAEEFFDQSRKGNQYNENHGYVTGATWSSTIPFRSQLGFKGITDADGNYSIVGFPYETGGTQYKFIPMLGVHQFDPAQQIRFVGDGAAIHNQVDFTDISSFKVTGTVKYRNTNFPVSGVAIRVDGKTMVDREGNVIETDNLGRFEVDVPIGRHSLQVVKNQHDFEDEGRFPPPDGAGNIVLFDYQEPVSGLEFIDTTLVRVAGRVVGGPIEAEKLLGFGDSKNNLGNASITLSTEKGYDLTLADSASDYSTTENKINSRAEFNSLSPKEMTVYPDTETGEFIAYLLPEKYMVKQVRAGSYTFDDKHHVTMDLQTVIWKEEVKEDTIGMAVSGIVDTESYPPYDPADYDEIFDIRRLDTVWTVGIDTFRFQHRQDFIYRVKPSINVTADQEGSTIFGDTVFVYEDENLGIREELSLVESGSYTFGHPVFRQRNSYRMFIELFEEYVNDDSGEADRVPVTDGRLEINNNLAVNDDKVIMRLNSLGKAVYTFTAGLPEINQDNVNAANSYTKTINISAFSGNDGGIKTIWNESEPFRAFVFGGMPTGNNFVTNGPTEVMTILRDPPGSGSFAYLSQGTTTFTTTSWDVTNTFSQENNMAFHLGAAVKTFAGIGAGVIAEVELTKDIEVGWSSEQVWNTNNEQTTSLTITKNWATSSSSDYVGADGDLFVGRSTNLVYGKSLFIEPIPVSQCTDCSDQEFNGYKLGVREGLRINPEFNTSFIYTQYHIENALLPELKNIRNSFLVYHENPASITPVSEPVYVSLVPASDPRFGSANNDISVWGDQAIDDMDNWGNGPSYVIRVPQLWIDEQRFVNDTVHYYNQQIEGWEFWLRENERQKVAAELDENISFDAGTTYDQSVTTTSSSQTTTTFEWFINPSVGFTTGGFFNKFGLSNTLTLAYGRGGSDSETTGSENSTTYGFTLADDNSGDYYSVDVKKPADGFGPVFTMRAGVTSCPYEDEQLTKYFEPGVHKLQEASMKREVPVLEVDQTIAKDIPDNRAAEFTLQLKNNSETEEAGWYTLRLDDSSNPFGAAVLMDGEPITDGRSFRVPYGKALQKTIMVWKGQSDQMDYEDLSLILTSLCDENLADTLSISAFFLPGCSDINIEMPKNQWVLNTNTRPEDTLLVKINQYDLTYDKFKKVVFQYKPTSSSQWTTNMVFYNKQKVTTEEFGAASDPKAWVDGPEINYYFDMHSLPDRTYDIRAVAVCELGPGSTVETPSQVLSGIKDVKRPRVFGTPQPADGVLSPNDEIMIQFDEAIEAGLLTPFNFSVRGVLNGAEINHNTSIDFDGTNDFVKVPTGLNIKNRNFTVEFWLKRDRLNQEEVIFSQGSQTGRELEIGFSASNQLFVSIAGQTITSTTTFTDTDWHHYAVAYFKESKELFAYYDDQFVLENVTVNHPYEGEGEILIGKSQISGNRHFAGNLHDLRVWNKAQQMGEVYAAMYQTQSGNEIGLVGYWPMDDAFGNKALDKARFRHALLYADWEVLPSGKAIAFDGVDDYVEINTASTVVISPQMDYSIEFWFKANAAQTNTVMFSSGKGDGTDKFNAPENSLSLGFNGEGKLYFTSNGKRLTLNDETDFRDDNWHHLALTLNRRANTILYLDGKPLITSPSSGFGGLAGASMWIGARGYKTGTVTTEHDQYFKGSIDDFRIWNLAHRGEQVDLTRTSKLSGEEMGLMAYYPFEEYVTVSGIQMSQETLDDQWINPYGSNAGTAQANGGATYTDNTPNIKDARPVQKVDFDWVVNQDKIIITPKASMAGAIEKCILEVTVQNIEDKYENRLVSPVTWSFFVDRNQVKWGDDQLEFEKKLYDPLTFTVEISNHGGAQQSFALENLPAWLTASPSAGVLEPLSTRKITFRVNEGINTGYYSEDIFLSSDFDYKEKLGLNLRVFEQEPAWQVDPAAFQYTMNIIAQLKIDGLLSTDRYDKVAAFIDGECRGIAQLEYMEQFDMYMAFLGVFSNVEFGEEIELRVWNASEGMEHREVSPDYIFQANQLKGIPSVPEIIEAGSTYVQEINFQKGWSWVSFNLQSPQLTDINGLLSNFSPMQGDQLKGQSMADVFTPGLGWVGTLSQNGGLRVGSMYMMKLAEAGSTSLTGQPALPGTPISISKGWNWVGFIPRFNMSVNEAFSGYELSSGDLVKSQYAFAVYDEMLGWIGTLKFLVPGQGYMFKSVSDGTLVYPETSLLNSNTRIAHTQVVESPWEAKVHQHPFTMSLMAEVAVEDASGLVLAAFVGDECRGISSPVLGQKGNPIFLLSVSGTDTEEAISLKVYDPENGRVLKVIEKLSFAPDKVEGTLRVPYQLHLDEAVLSVQEPREIAVEMAPNPFSDQLYIRIVGLPTAQPEVKVIDVIGKVITTLSPDEQDANLFTWDGTDGHGNDVSTGIYMVSVSLGSETKVYKIIKR